MSDDKHREIVQTIDFPPQRWFGKLKQSTVDERVKGLGTWLSVRSSPAHRCALRFAATESGVRLVQKICAAPKVLGSPILAQFLGGTGPTAAGGS